jgi:hypothetical protein
MAMPFSGTASFQWSATCFALLTNIVAAYVNHPTKEVGREHSIEGSKDEISNIIRKTGRH